MNQENTTSTDADAPLPFLRLHPLTVLYALTQRMWIFIAIAVFAGVVGILSALLFGEQMYEAGTILLYKAAAENTEADLETPSLATLLNMVKLEGNLEFTRQELSLPATLKQIASSCSVTVQKGTTLMTISVRWNDAQLSARIANTLRDAFLENQRVIRRDKAGKTLASLSIQLESVRSLLSAADDQLNAYAVSNQIVDLGKEAQWYLEQLTTLDTMCGEKRMQEKALNIQLANLDTLISNLNIRVAQEQNASASQLESVTENNVRIQRLRELIQEDKDYREDLALLTNAKIDLDRSAYLLAIGAVSSSAYNTAVAKYEQLKARTVDTDQILEWREEINKLDKTVVPVAGSSPSGDLLKSLMLKAFDLQLMQVSIEKEAESLEQSRDSVKSKLDKLPEFQRVYIALEREVNTLNAEKKRLDETLALTRRQYESQATGFSIISQAKPPVFPKRSSRKKVAVVVAGLLMLLGSLLLTAREVFEPCPRSAGEAAAKTLLPALAAIPLAPAGAALMPRAGSPIFIEEFRECVRAVRSRMPAGSRSILITAAGFSSGTTTIAANLAAALGRQDERVLLVDAQVRDPLPRLTATSWPAFPRLKEWLTGLARILAPLLRRAPTESCIPTFNSLDVLLPGGSAGVTGLGDYLLQTDNDVESLVQPTTLTNVWYLPRGRNDRTPDLLGSTRMREALNSLSRAFSIVILDAPPADCHVDAETLSLFVDSVIVVIRAGKCSTANVSKAIARFSAGTAPVIGIIVNAIEPLYSRL